MKNNEKKLKIISLFSGCGGMDLGFKGGFDVLRKSVNVNLHPDWIENTVNKYWVRLPKTNFETILANDILPAAKASWVPYFDRENKNGSLFLTESIVDLVKRHNAGENNIFPAADIVIGGFPCQDFSVAGKRNGFASRKAHHGGFLKGGEPSEESRGKLYMWMRAVIDIVRPKIFIAENVKGLISLADVKKIIERDFRSIGENGYLVVDAKVLRAQDFGVPQTRERVIFIGFKKEALTKIALERLSNLKENSSYDPYPCPTHGDITKNSLLSPYLKVQEAFAGLKEPEESRDLAQKYYSKAKWYGKHCQGQSEIDLMGLGPTIRAEHHGNIEFRRLSKEHGGRYHDELASGLKERRLSVRECARIQTFPDNFEFIRSAHERGEEFAMSPSDGYRVIGNAVPPLLAFHVAWRLRELWPKLFKRGET
ncbi:MAG: DNA (cytosine-5-)-methyltransferase [Candidatus Omnitrophica bacterium CG11_big_fil_rev_8_21_14_0_20_42_13]|uniref:Cytosine-specific methyltransferase n=1 Tax=Candidatus Ghiorseimicrobium undicola TaxID=1974746 RepID=A0A2H0LVN3_9BACT|nr:MAG: DNA (cytosine-5-)-methyltransferase [Candidatus Omnitrophica bacterium CG11_big_fil_rev_8_21_14_0_20_42_13]